MSQSSGLSGLDFGFLLLFKIFLSCRSCLCPRPLCGAGEGKKDDGEGRLRKYTCEAGNNLVLIFDRQTLAPVRGACEGRWGLVDPRLPPCLAETLSLMTELVFEGSSCSLQGHLESSQDPVSDQLCVLGHVMFPLLTSCSSSVQ